MPLVARNAGSNVVTFDGSDAVVEQAPSDVDVVMDEVKAAKLRCLQEYRRMVDATKDILLLKLTFSPAGVRLFDDLCRWVDVNQELADMLPQWSDVAKELELSALKTKWVRTCVRPKEGLTRAMLEIYMADGGTLGDVLEALLKLECLQILQELKSRVWEFLDEESSPTPQKKIPSDQFFSILATLAAALGQDDPFKELQQLSGGLLKRKMSQDCLGSKNVSEGLVHSVLVQSPAEMLSCDPNYKALAHLGTTTVDQGLKYSKRESRWDEQEDISSSTCRILLLFAEDGVEAAENVYNTIQGMELLPQGVRAEVFRLNETTLWLEVLVHMEACCLKWAYEADYVMPILTPQFLREVRQGGSQDNLSMLVPTSPLINRFMYTLLRQRYLNEHCRNTMVRPVIPEDVVFAAGTPEEALIQRDPIFRLAWIKENRLQRRVKGMLTEFSKRRG